MEPMGGGDFEPTERTVGFFLNPIHAFNGRHEGRGGFEKELGKGPVEWGNTSGIDGPWVTVTVVQSWKGRGAAPGEIQRGEKAPDCAVVGSPRAQAWARKGARRRAHFWR